MKRAISTIILLFLVFGLDCSAFAFKKDTQENVAISFIIEKQSDRNINLIKIFKEEIDRLLGAEYDVSYVKNKKADIDISFGGIQSADFMVFDPDSMLVKLDNSNIKKVSNTKSYNPLKNDIKDFHKLVKFKKLAVVVDEGYKHLKNRIEKTIASDDYSVAIISPNAEIPKNIDAIYLSPFLDEDIKGLISVINKHKIPSFSNGGEYDVRLGVMASRARNDYERMLARQTAVNIQKTLKGKVVKNHIIDFPHDGELCLNQKTAGTVGFSPSWEVLQSAKLFGEVKQNQKLTLGSVIKEVQNNNLDLQAKTHHLNAVKREQTLAKLKYMPHIELNSGFTQIDRDRAEASRGFSPEYTGSFGIGFTQNIFSDKLNSNITSKRFLTEKTEAEKRELELNIAAESAVSFIEMLRLQSYLDLQKDYLEHSKQNLKFAKAREAVGQSGKDDVYRWQSQVAMAQRDVVNAQSSLKTTKISFNKLLNRNQSDDFGLEVVEINHPALISGRVDVIKFIETPAKFEIFANRLVLKAVEFSPELRRASRLIDIKKRELKANNREFFLPEIQLNGSVAKDFTRKFVGSTRLGGNNFNGQVGIYANLPIFSGGERFVNNKKLKDELNILELQKEQTRNNIEELVRKHLDLTLASHLNKTLMSEAARNAQKTFKLIQNQYRVGVASIIDLLDAQKNLLTAKQLEKSTNYDFMINMIWLQRALGSVDFSKQTDDDVARLLDNI